MADNVHKKIHRVSTDGSGCLAGRKLSTPVHHSVAETAYLDESDNQLQSHIQSVCGSQSISNSTVTSNSQCRKKTSSFQITSVTVGCRMSNDTGEDSNDDLDESHTEENSIEHSRVAEIETPSYSEETFSKEDVFFNASNGALSTAPVIPTSSQYGLAIVPSSERSNSNNLTNDSNINTLDITSVTNNNIINLLSNSTKQDSDLREVHSHSRNERFKVVKIESTEPFKRGRWTCMDYLDHTSVHQTSVTTTPKTSALNEVCISYGVTDSGIISLDSKISDEKNLNSDLNGQISHPDAHPAQCVSSGACTTSGTTNSFIANNTMGKALQHATSSKQTVQSTQIPPQYFQTPPTQQQAQSPQQGSTAAGSTLPLKLHSSHSSNIPQPQGSISVITQSSNTNAVQDEPYVAVNTQTQVIPGQTVCQSTSNSAGSQGSNILVPSLQNNQQINISDPLTSVQGIQSMQGVHNASQPNPVQQISQPQVISSTQIQSQQSTNNVQVQRGSVVSGVSHGSITFHQPDHEPDSVSSLASTSNIQSASSDTTLLESLAEVTQSIDDQQVHEDNESMSGTSAVAIDNKIEQAMDLVKSHLMFAVREEVEVLKEKIAELMDRINHLEAENSILKSHASPDILAQLNQSNTKMPINNSGNSQ